MKIRALKPLIPTFLIIDRLICSLSFATILFLCHYGFAEKLRRLLSLKYWIVFEKMGLSIFIAHAFVLKWQFYTLEGPVEWTYSFMVILIPHEINLNFIFIIPAQQLRNCLHCNNDICIYNQLLSHPTVQQHFQIFVLNTEIKTSSLAH
jgi:hypothetical protein